MGMGIMTADDLMGDLKNAPCKTCGEKREKFVAGACPHIAEAQRQNAPILAAWRERAEPKPKPKRRKR